MAVSGLDSLSVEICTRSLTCWIYFLSWCLTLSQLFLWGLTAATGRPFWLSQLSWVLIATLIFCRPSSPLLSYFCSYFFDFVLNLSYRPQYFNSIVRTVILLLFRKIFRFLHYYAGNSLLQLPSLDFKDFRVHPVAWCSLADAQIRVLSLRRCSNIRAVCYIRARYYLKIVVTNEYHNRLRIRCALAHIWIW